MTWVKLDDGFLTNPKVLASGKDGRALIIAGLLYCARELTDGLIVDGAAPLIAGGADVKLRPTASRLVALGIWHRDGHTCPRCPPCPPGHYLVHDYLDWQPSAEDERAKRKAISEKRAAAGRKGAAARWGNGHGNREASQPVAMANEWQTGDEPWQTDDSRMAPSPVPPVVKTGQQSSSTAYDAADDDDDDPLVALVTATAVVLGDRDHQRRLAAEGLEPVVDRRRHRQSCIERWCADQRLADAAIAHPDLEPDQLADVVDPPPKPVLTVVASAAPSPAAYEPEPASERPAPEFVRAQLAQARAPRSVS